MKFFSGINRRTFVKSQAAVLVTGAPVLLSGQSLNSKIRVGIIGVVMQIEWRRVLNKHVVVRIPLGGPGNLHERLAAELIQAENIFRPNERQRFKLGCDGLIIKKHFTDLPDV